MATRRLKSILTNILPNRDRDAGSDGAVPSQAEDGKKPKDGPATKNTDESGVGKQKVLPTYDELPAFNNYPGCAWEVWGKGDQLGTVNLLTDDVVQRAAQEEIRIGKSVSLNWPLNFPSKPVFGRKPPEILMKAREPKRITRDDEIHINTQSGTQWDGLRHFAVLEHGVFYGNTPTTSLPMGVIPMPDPNDIDQNLRTIGIQNWSNHGISGRGVLLDLVRHFTIPTQGTDTDVAVVGQSKLSLSYDPWTTHGFSVADLQACAAKQGVEFRAGDILLLRAGFIRKYYEAGQEERDALAGKEETFAGIEQSEDMKRFLWNNHFAAIASDQPALERWPVPEGTHFMHETILGLWGMPIGEFFDLEALAETCASTGRYTFFFSSWPLNIIGGCASPPNAAAYF